MITAFSKLRAATLCIAISLAFGDLQSWAKDAVKSDGAKPAATKPAAAKPDTAKPDTAKADQTKSTADSAPAPSRGPSLAEHPVGAKSPEELVKKLQEAYHNKDGAIYLSLIKAPVRTRIRMHHLFKHDSRTPASNFRFVTVAEEAARFKESKETVGKATTVGGVKEDYPLPVVGFIDFDSTSFSDSASDRADKQGLAVGKDKNAYFIVTRQPVAGTASAAGGTAAVPATPAAPAAPKTK